MIKISQTTILAFLVFIILGSTLISAVTYNKEQLKEGQLIREHLIKSDVAIASYDEISGEIVITAISDGNIAIDEKIYSVSSGTKINIHSDNSKTIILKQSFNDGYASLFNLVNQKLKISNESKYSIQFNTYVLRNLKKIYLTRDIKTKELNGFVISATDNNTQTINFVEIILDEDDKLTLNKGQPIINKESALRIGNSIIEAHENVVLLSSKDKDGNIEYQIQGKSFSIDDKTFSGKVFTTPKLNSFFVRGKFEDETNGISFDSSQNPVGINIIYGETGAPLLENEIRITEEDYGTIITSYGKPYNVKFKVGDEEYKGNNAIIIANDGLGRVLIDNGGELKKGAITLKQENGLKLLKSDLRELENIATTPTVLFSKDTKGFINENGELVLQKKGKSNTVAIATFDRVQTRVSEMPNIVEDIKNEKWESLSNRLALLELENPAEYEKVESILKESFGQDFVDVIKKEKLESQDLDELSLMKANFQPTEAASLAVNIAREKGISWQAMVASPFAKGLAGPAFYATRFIPEERLIHDTLKRTDLNDEDKKQLLADNLPKEYLIQRFKLMGGIGVSNVEEARRQKIGFEEGPMGFLARGATEEFDFYKDVMNKAGYDDNFLDNLLKQNADEEMMMVASMAVPLGIMKSPAGIAAKTVLNSADDATRLAASMSDDWATKTTSAPITFELSAPLEARKPIIIEFNERVPKMVKKTIYEEGKTIEIFDPVYTSSGKPIVEKVNKVKILVTPQYQNDAAQLLEEAKSLNFEKYNIKGAGTNFPEIGGRSLISVSKREADIALERIKPFDAQIFMSNNIEVINAIKTGASEVEIYRKYATPQNLPRLIEAANKNNMPELAAKLQKNLDAFTKERRFFIFRKKPTQFVPGKTSIFDGLNFEEQRAATKLLTAGEEVTYNFDSSIRFMGKVGNNIIHTHPGWKGYPSSEDYRFSTADLLSADPYTVESVASIDAFSGKGQLNVIYYGPYEKSMIENYVNLLDERKDILANLFGEEVPQKEVLAQFNRDVIKRWDPSKTVRYGRAIKIYEKKYYQVYDELWERALKFWESGKIKKIPTDEIEAGAKVVALKYAEKFLERTKKFRGFPELGKIIPLEEAEKIPELVK